jgi:hypothetical protein
MQMFERWIDIIAMCTSLPMSAPACRPFWENVMYASAVIGLLLAVWAVWKFIDYRLKYAAALRAEAERERIADADTMKQHTWVEHGNITDEVTDPDLARKIRQELEQRRAQNLRS